MIRFTATVSGDLVLDRAFNRVTEYISDFRPIWPSVAAEFYQIQREQFASQGSHGASGTWAPLSPAYASYKAVTYPNQPILRASTELYQSMTSPDAKDSIFRSDANELTMGTQREGATAHQRGSGKMPARPIISLTDDDKRRLTKAIQLPLVQFVRRQGFIVEERAA